MSFYWVDCEEEGHCLHEGWCCQCRLYLLPQFTGFYYNFQLQDGEPIGQPDYGMTYL